MCTDKYKQTTSAYDIKAKKILQAHLKKNFNLQTGVLSTGNNHQSYKMNVGVIQL